MNIAEKLRAYVQKPRACVQKPRLCRFLIRIITKLPQNLDLPAEKCYRI